MSAVLMSLDKNANPTDVQTLYAWARETIDGLKESANRRWELQQAITDQKRRLKLHEYTLVREGLEGKNEREREANLQLAIAEDPAIIEVLETLRADEDELAGILITIDAEERLYKLYVAAIRAAGGTL